MPATLPWPKIAQTPPKIGTFSPSITVIWRVMKRVSACAIVRRIVLLIMVLRRPRADTTWQSLCSLAAARGKPRLGQALETPRHVGDGLLVRQPAGEPFLGSVGEDGAADGETLDDWRVGRGREGGFEFVLRRVEAEQHHAPAPRVVPRDSRLDVRPCTRRRLRLELPPVRLDAECIEFFQRARHSLVFEWAVLAGDDFYQQLAPHLARGIEQRAQLLLLLLLQRRRVLRMIEAQAFYAVVDRPFSQLRADVLAELEAQRP